MGLRCLFIVLVKKNVKIEIGGHTENVGGSDANQALSTELARVVRTLLLEEGIEFGRITIKVYVSSEPRSKSPSDPANQRVEIKVLER